MYRLGRCGMRAEMIRALNGQVGAGRRLNSKAGALVLQWSYIAHDENVRFAMSRATSWGIDTPYAPPNPPRATGRKACKPG